MANQQHLTKLRECLQRGEEGITTWNQWRKADLSRADLRKADLRKADLRKADLSRADLSRADLSGTLLSRTDLRASRLDNTNLHEASLREASLSGASLSGADLSGTDLSGADLSGTDLRDADLSGTDLRDADLRDADLRDADLRDAGLNWAHLRWANLSGADLRGADLSGADLDGVHLANTNFSNTTCTGNTFANVDLRTVKGLTSILHRGPSIIDLHTIQLPQDGSALHFLRGAGVPNEWIDFYRATMMHPIQYHSCFISYSSKDKDFAKRIYADLQNQGVRCWFAPEDMKIGDEIRTRIDESIHIHDKLLLILSEHSVKSTWVKKEVETTFEKEEQQQRLALFPVRVDEAVMQTAQAWAADIRRMRHIGDFTRWKEHDEYQLAFNRLLRDLKAQS